MRWKIKVGNERGDWIEELDEPLVENRQQALNISRAIIKRYNDTLRPGEIPRTLLGISKDLKLSIKHKWEKINLVSKMAPGSLVYDEYKCSVCGVTGKRFGISEYIRMDKRWNNKSCFGKSI